jgi:hypothetical protein
LKLQTASPHHEEAGWEAVPPLVAVSDAGWEAEADRVVQRLGVADRLVDVGEPERPGEVEEAVGVGGRVVTEDAGQRQHPPIAFEHLEGPGPRMLGRRGVQDCQVAVEGVGRQPVGPGRIAQSDPHLLPIRPGVAERVQPCRGARAAAAGVDHQVGAQQLLGAAVGPTQHPRPGHAATVGGGGQPDDVAAVQERQVGQGPYPGPHVTLQEWSAGAQEHQSGVRLPEPVAAEVQARVGQQVPGRRPVGDQFLGEPGEQLLQGLLPARSSAWT